MHSYFTKLQLFSQAEAPLLAQGLHGLEKESLRINAQKQLSDQPHPRFLGSPLTHPNFSTDFAEAQLELITPPYTSLEQAIKHLKNLHLYIARHLQEEYLWPMSAPCALPLLEKVQLAQYGDTKAAYEKWLYREGLSHRYGKAMQLLSGIHYSFSLPQSFWKNYQKKLNSKKKSADFVSEHYLHLIRNFLRRGWICSYLFGASPIVDKSYLKEKTSLLNFDERGAWGTYATSIRMSHLGYFSQIQCQSAVSFNTLREYLHDIKLMLNTKSTEFQKIGLYRNQKQIQMNENILQIEAEHYSRIRPKPTADSQGRPLDALKKGIGYVESRILDLNPFCENGVDLETLRFMHLFLLYCLFKESPSIEKEERCDLFQNQNKVALSGRKPNLKLVKSESRKPITLKEWSLEILEELKPLATLLDQNDSENVYQKVLEKQKVKIFDPTHTPSARILKEMHLKQQSFTDFSFKKAQEHKKALLQQKITADFISKTKKEVKHSLDLLKQKEEAEDMVFAGYEDLEFSTQMLLKEALRQNIQFNLLDRKENIVELHRGSHREWIKQASQTRLDSLVSYHLMENKQVTKSILNNHGIEVPQGKLYTSTEQALHDYSHYEEIKVVVKPNLANMGEGISFVEPRSYKSYKKALEEANKFNQDILVEEFIAGDEYRFLVIQNQVVAVCKRMPANVEGDGKNTLKQLVSLKNKSNRPRAQFQKPVALTPKVKKVIQSQGYGLNEIPKKGEVIKLRENSNVSTGGESIDYTDEMPLFYQEIALKATSCLGASICGVDMLIQNLKKTPSPHLYRIIELNYNPALFLHRYPTKGKKRAVEKEILKALGF